MKKLLSLLLIFCMVIGAVPAFAEEAEQSIPETWQIVYDWRNKTSLFWAEINGETCTIKAVAQYQNDELFVPYKEALCVKEHPSYNFGDPITVSTFLLDKDALKKGAEMVTTITFADGYEILPDGLCEGMYNLTTVNLPKSLYAIGNKCFKDCENLENINLENVQFIGTDAFLGTKFDTEHKNETETVEAETSKFSDVAADSIYADAVEVLSALGIMTGYDDGTFKPDITLTRAEAAAIIVRLLNLEVNPTGGETSFSDVAENYWASGYISWATENGIINGHGDGTFAPEEFVTEHQLIKMLVCTLGYEPVAMANGGWMNYGYITAAEKIGLIEKDPSNKNVHIKRGEAALMCYKALDIDFMEWVESTTGIQGQMYRICENETILTDYWDYEKIEGVIKESAGKLLIKVTKTYADKSCYVIGQVFTFEDERLREFVDSIVTAYVKKTADAKNELLFAKKITQ